MKRREFAVAVAGIFAASVLAFAAHYAYAADGGKWYQGHCGKCGYKTSKILQYSGCPSDMECVIWKDGKRCGGLVKYGECSPPG